MTTRAPAGERPRATAVERISRELEAKNRRLQQVIRIATPYLPPNLRDELFAKAGPRLEARKKKLAIFSADIRDYSAISARARPEVIIDLLNFYFYFVFSLLLEHGGKIDKVMGDGILAVFEPTPAEPDPCRAAVRAALAIQGEMLAFNDILLQSPRLKTVRHLGRIRVGIGIHYDTVVQGNLGTPDKMDYTIIGDGVNLATRCQQLARAGEVVVSETVFRRVRGLVRAVRRAEVRLKGQPEPVPLRWVQARTPSAGSGPDAAVPAP